MLLFPHSLPTARLALAFCRPCVLTMLVLFAAAPCHTANSAEGRYAFLVGVENYEPTELPDLDWAVDDIEGIGKALKNLGFLVVSMTSNDTIPSRHPSNRDDIVDQLDTFLNNLSKDDTVVVAFSGHGVQLKTDASDPAGVKELYFCPEKADCSDPTTLVPMSLIMGNLNRCKAGRKLLLVDACRSDITPPSKSKTVPITELPAAGYKRPPVPVGMTAMFSCSPEERSFEIAKLSHSIFSHHVIEYLSGGAPPDRYKNGELYINELTAYVKSNTRDTAHLELNTLQTPEIHSGDPTGRFIDWSLGSLEVTPAPPSQFTNSVGIRLIKIVPPEAEAIPFWISCSEITQQHWASVFATNPAYFSPDGPGKAKVTGIPTQLLPVENISWVDASEYCKKITVAERATGRLPPDFEYRLPASSEWLAAYEFNARSNAFPPTVWSKQIANGHPHPIETEPSAPYALLNMTGNVWEWCLDQEPDDVTGEPLYMARGGSWLDRPEKCSPLSIQFERIDGHSNTTGFRIVLAQPTAKQ